MEAIELKVDRLIELAINNRKSRSEDKENVPDILPPVRTEEELADLLNSPNIVSENNELCYIKNIYLYLPVLRIFLKIQQC